MDEYVLAAAAIYSVSQAAKKLFEVLHKQRMHFREPSLKIEHALADKEVALIKQQQDMELDLRHRAFNNFVDDTVQRHENKESITYQALRHLDDSAARPTDVDVDWIRQFYDKCSAVSNQQKQAVWARALALEVNNPGSVSLRAMNLLSELSLEEIGLMLKLFPFALQIGAVLEVIVYLDRPQLYLANGLSMELLDRLASLGLVEIVRDGRLVCMKPEPNINYYGSAWSAENIGGRWVELGNVRVSAAVKDLFYVFRHEVSPIKQVELEFRCVFNNRPLGSVHNPFAEVSDSV